MISKIMSSPVSFAGKVKIGKDKQAKREMAERISRFPADKQDSIINGLNSLKSNLEANTNDACNLMIGFYTASQDNPDDYMCAYVYGTGFNEHTKYAHSAHRTDGTTTIMDASASEIEDLFTQAGDTALQKVGMDDKNKNIKNILNRLA